MPSFAHASVNEGSIRSQYSRGVTPSFSDSNLTAGTKYYYAVQAVNAAGASVSFSEIVTDFDHDAFLLDEPEMFAIARGFIDSAARARGLERKADR